MSEAIHQNTDSWLSWRRQGIGASDAPIIMGVSPYKTPYQLWEEKLGINSHDNGNDYVKSLGHKFEKNAKSQLNLELDMDLDPECVEHESHPWIRASFDAIDLDSEVFAEIKYVGAKKYDWIEENKKPLPQHFPQLMHQFLVSGFKKGYYVAYTLDEGKKNISRIQRIQVEPDLEYIKEMFQALEEFWECVKNQKPPGLSDSDAKVIEDKTLSALAEDYLKLKKTSKEIDTILKNMESMFKSYVDHPRCQVGPLEIKKIVKKGAVDYSKVPELKGVKLDQYRKEPSTQYRFEPKKND